MHRTAESSIAMDVQLESQMQDLGRTQLALLDLIDDIQASQIQTDSLPQIAVVGDQSSGKSSALETITGIPFPRASGACTKYATEIRLRRSATPSFKVSILPDPGRSRDSQTKLLNFGETISSGTSFDQLFYLAKEAITAESSRWASDDKLIVEKSGPDQPLLTLVDLPGIISIANENQSLEDKAAIEGLTDRYMSNPSTVILAVVGASTDYAVAAKILEKTRQYDPEGSRTIGVLTKPDLAERDGHTEGYLRLVTNKDRVNCLALGWNVLLNPPNNVTWSTVALREQKEREFFSLEGWNTLDPRMCGAYHLRSKLSVQLQRQISTYLPAIRKDLSERLTNRLKSQARLGQGYNSLDAMREGITEFLNRSSKLAERSVSGFYLNVDGDDFFDHKPGPMGSPPQKIRARVVKANYTFSNSLRNNGHSEGFISASGPFAEPRNNSESKKRSYARDQVAKMIEQNVGTHLPGHESHQIPYQLFQMHSKKWEEMAREHIIKIKNICNQFINEVLTHIWPTKLQEPIRRHLTMVILEEIYQQAEGELRRLSADLQYEVQVYDPDFPERVKKWQEARKPAQGEGSLEPTWTSAELLLEESLILYDIIGRSFIRDVTVKIVERHFLQGIRGIFDSKRVYSMEDAIIESIAGEDEQTTELRFRLKAEIDKLRATIAKIDNLPRQLATSSYGEDNRENGWAAQNNTISSRQPLRPPPAGGLSSYSDEPPQIVEPGFGIQVRPFEYHEFSRNLTGHLEPEPPKGRFQPPPSRDVEVPEAITPSSTTPFSDRAEVPQLPPRSNHKSRVSNESNIMNGMNGSSTSVAYNKHHSVPTRPPPGIPTGENRGHGYSNSTSAAERIVQPNENGSINGSVNGQKKNWLLSMDLSHPFSNDISLEDEISIESDRQSQMDASRKKKSVNGFSKLVHRGREEASARA